MIDSRHAGAGFGTESRKTKGLRNGSIGYRYIEDSQLSFDT